MAPQAAPTEEPVASFEAEDLLEEARRLLEQDAPDVAVAYLEELFLQAPGTPGLFPLLERARLEDRAHLEARLGSLDHRPVIQCRPEHLMTLSLAPGAGYLLSQIDGEVTFEELFAIAAMERVEAARILVLLLQERIIA